jgi:hypothetical protein
MITFRLLGHRPHKGPDDAGLSTGPLVYPQPFAPPGQRGQPACHGIFVRNGALVQGMRRPADAGEETSATAAPGAAQAVIAAPGRVRAAAVGGARSACTVPDFLDTERGAEMIIATSGSSGQTALWGTPRCRPPHQVAVESLCAGGREGAAGGWRERGSVN